MTSPTHDYSTTRRLVHEKPSCFDSITDGVVTLLKSPNSEEKIAEGGLRLQGIFKNSSEHKPLITIVTVVYNGAKFLENTIKSVIQQTYDNVEYIIVDGGSTDGTLDIIKKYEHAIDYWVSEPDKGIYDAMNKAIELGSGNWINFMNAGDDFINVDVLVNVFNQSEGLPGFDVIYGDHEVRYPHKLKVVKAGKVKNLWKGSQFCHQSTFVRLNFHKKNKFNLCFKIAADFNFFYKSSQSDAEMIYIPCVVSRVSSGGVSDVKRLKSIVERFRCLNDPFYKFYYYLYVFSLESIKIVVKKIC